MLFDNSERSACARKQSFLHRSDNPLTFYVSKTISLFSEAGTTCRLKTTPVRGVLRYEPRRGLEFQVKGMILAQSERWRRV